MMLENQRNFAWIYVDVWLSVGAVESSCKPTETVMGIVPSCLIYVSCAKHNLASKQKNQSYSRPLELVDSDVVAQLKLVDKNHFPAYKYAPFSDSACARIRIF